MGLMREQPLEVPGYVIEGPVVEGPVVDGPVVEGPVVEGPAGGERTGGAAGAGAGAGARWLGRDAASGRRVVLEVLDVSGAQRETVLRQAARLAALSHPHLLPVLDVVDAPAGPVLVTELARGGDLAHAIDAYGPLRPGEVVTACAPVAQALDAVHGRGFVHGHLSPASLVFSAAGRPLLAGLGAARPGHGLGGGAPGYAAPEVAAGGEPTPAADVYGLAAVASAALAGEPYRAGLPLPAEVPAASAAALARATSADPAARPSAADLARALFAMAAPVPVRIAPGAGPTPQPSDGAAGVDGGDASGDVVQRLRAALADADRRPGRRTRGGRRARGPSRVDPGRVVALAAVPVLLVAAVLVGLQLAGGDPEPSPAATLPAVQNRAAALAADPGTLCGPPAPAPSQAPADPADWTEAVRVLYAARTQAFLELDPSLLCEVYLPTSEGLAGDVERLQTFARNRVRPVGLAFEVSSVVVVGRSGGVVQLDVTDELPGYDLVDDVGQVRTPQEGLAEETWRAELVPSYDGTGWRFG